MRNLVYIIVINLLFLNAHALMIQTQKPSLEWAQTNKERAHLSAATGKWNTRKWHGFVVDGNLYVNNFVLRLGETDAGNLNEKTWQSTQVYDDHIERHFDLFDGVTHITESIFLADDQNSLLVRYIGNWEGRAYFFPHFDLRPAGNTKGDRSYHFEGNNTGITVSKASMPFAVALSSNSSSAFIQTDFSIWNGFVFKNYGKDAERGEATESEAFQPGSLQVEFNGKADFAFYVAPKERALAQAQIAAAEFDTLLAKKKERTDAQIYNGNEQRFTTKDSTYNSALAWAHVAGDQFLMNLGGKGIIAGLPWFKEYWGRDLFISFRGLILDTGKYALAKEILETGFRNIDRNTASSTYGRIPNIVRDNSQSLYNTADATPWFLNSLAEYVLQTGDVTFLQTHAKDLQTIFDGEALRTDSLGFSIHGDQETWMDGMIHLQKDGKEMLVPCSPRGNRAVEVQALWASAYKGIAKVAASAGTLEIAKLAEARASKISTNFLNTFWNAKDATLYDHIKVTGEVDDTARPNTLFALSMPFIKLLTEQQAQHVIDSQFRDGVLTSWGVRSLGTDASFFNPFLAQLGSGFCNPFACDGVIKFHPHHDYGSHVGIDHSDWSYHNGDVWHWLSGPAVSALVRSGKTEEAAQLTHALAYHLLNGSTLGTLAEIMDGELGSSAVGIDRGTYAQAWSVAEFVRNFYEDYLGYHNDVLNGKILLEPRPVFGATSAWVPYGMSQIKVTTSADATALTLDTRNLPRSTRFQLQAKLHIDKGVNPRALKLYASNKELSFKITEEDASWCLESEEFAARGGEILALVLK